MDNFTALYTSYLHFTLGTESMHTEDIFVFVLASFYKLMLFEFEVKDTGTINHVQIA